VEILEGLEGLRGPLRNRDWDALEGTARRACSEGDPGVADAIAAVDVSAFEAMIESDLRALSVTAWDERAAAVYWEFDPEDDWNSAFFLCASYEPEEADSDDWAADFDDETVVVGPSMPELAELYEPSWQDDEMGGACNLYLIARTMAAFGRAAARSWSAGLPLCSGYHDQQVVFRVYEPKASSLPERRLDFR
jgi:hypothetical protein